MPRAPAEDPENQEQDEDDQEDSLIPGHGSHRLEPRSGQFRCLGGPSDLGGIQAVDDQRHDQEAQDSGDGCRERPARPGDLDALLCRELRSERIRRHGGEEHGAGHHHALVGGEREEAGDPSLGSSLGVAAERRTERLQNGIDDTAGARRVAWDGRREDQVGGHQAVRKSEAPFAEETHEVIRDANAKAGLDEGGGNKKRGDDEPHDRVAEAGRGFRDGQGAGEDGEGGCRERHGAHRDGPEHDPNHRGDEDGQQMPRPRIHLRRNRDEPECGSDEDRRRQTPDRDLGRGPLIRRLLRYRSHGLVRLHLSR